MLKFLKNRNIQIIIFFSLLVVFIFVFTQSHTTSHNPISRFVTIKNLAENGSFVLNDYGADLTGDIIMRNGNYYSSKPPLLSVIGAGFYYLLHFILKLNLPADYHSPNLAVYLITLLFTSAAYLLLLVYFYRTLKLLQIDKKYQLDLLSGLALGTLLFTYCLTFNNHIIAACFLYLSFYYLLKNKVSPPAKSLNFILSGFFVSLCAAIDLPIGFAFLGLFCVYIFFKYDKKNLFYYLLAALPVVLVHLILTYQITGDLWPAQVHQNLYLPGTIADPKENNVLLYVFNILIGTRGLFLYTPLLILSFYSLIKIIVDKKNTYRSEAIVTLAGFLIVFLFYVIKIRVYSGCAYGFRWFIALTPLLYFWTIFLFKTKPSLKLKITFGVLILLSIILAALGSLDPWLCPYLPLPLNNGVQILNFPLGAMLFRLFS